MAYKKVSPNDAIFPDEFEPNQLRHKQLEQATIKNSDSCYYKIPVYYKHGNESKPFIVCSPPMKCFGLGKKTFSDNIEHSVCCVMYNDEKKKAHMEHFNMLNSVNDRLRKFLEKEKSSVFTEEQLGSKEIESLNIWKYQMEKSKTERGIEIKTPKVDEPPYFVCKLNERDGAFPGCKFYVSADLENPDATWSEIPNANLDNYINNTHLTAEVTWHIPHIYIDQKGRILSAKPRAIQVIFQKDKSSEPLTRTRTGRSRPALVPYNKLTPASEKVVDEDVKDEDEESEPEEFN